MARSRGRKLKQSPPSPARVAVLLGTGALCVLLLAKLHAFLGSPSGQGWFERAGERLRTSGAALSPAPPRPERDPTAVALAEKLAEIGITPAAIDRQHVTRPITGERASERWTVSAPTKVALVDCHRLVSRGVGSVGLKVLDAWEHTDGDERPALSLSLGDEHGEERYRLTFVRIPPPERARIAVVIDDFGSHWNDAARAFLEFPEALTLAILPGYRSSGPIADAARERGHEVILHLPMEPEGYPRVDPGPEAILVGQKPAEIRARIRRALKSVGEVTGVSNHMGSLATTDTGVMRIVLEETRDQGLYFLDSRTTPRSVARRVARRVGTPSAVNRLFLDDDRDGEAIARRFEEAMGIALARGEVVIVGHAYPETYEVLTAALPGLRENDIRLVTLSEVVERPLVF